MDSTEDIRVQSHRANRTAVAAKVTIPRLPSDYVSRPRLVRAIETCPKEQIVLIHAPAGYGKTLLVAEWAGQAADRTAWVSLNPSCNRDRLFWSAILMAINSCPAIAEFSSIRNMTLPDRPSRDVGFLTKVAKALKALVVPIRLVLDGIEEIVTDEARYGLEILVREWPAQSRLVLVSRTARMSLLSRLGVADRLVEILSRDIAFSRDEANALLMAGKFAFNSHVIDSAIEQSDGWIVGLRLSLLSLRNAGDLAEFRPRVALQAGPLAAYLADEVIAPLPTDARHLLETASICDDVSGALAVALCDRPDAGEELRRLARDTALLVPSGEGDEVFRMNPLLRAYLSMRLREGQPERVALLHGRASAWFVANGRPDAALAHAQSAGIEGPIVDLIRQFGPSLIASGYATTVRTSLEALPANRVASDPALSLSTAMVHLDSGELQAADADLIRAEACWPPQAPAELVRYRAVVKARLRWLAGSAIANTLPDCDRRDDHVNLALPVGLDSVEALVRASVEIASSHRPEMIRSYAQSAMDRAAKEKNTYLAAHSLAVLGLAAAIAGDLRKMVEFAAQAKGLLDAGDWQSVEERALVTMMLGLDALMRAEPADCLQLLTTSPKTARTLRLPLTARLVESLEAAARFDLGERAAALEMLRAARLAIARDFVFPDSLSMVAHLEFHAAMLLGYTQEARAALEWLEAKLGQTGETLLMHACLAVRISRHAAARKFLAPLLDRTVPAVLAWSVAEGWLLECEIAQYEHNNRTAVLALERAVATFASAGVRRPLMWAPQPIIDLLARELGNLSTSETFAREILTERAQREQRPLPVLTARERTLLALLPTQRSLKEIADYLSISSNTIKTHLKAIYGKLDVGSRREAVTAACRLGLLDHRHAGPY